MEKKRKQKSPVLTSNSMENAVMKISVNILIYQKMNKINSNLSKTVKVNLKKEYVNFFNKETVIKEMIVNLLMIYPKIN